ncbi:hypothetical protein GALL_339020 [mine drainage metagenome]|uniref:Uncharacterized protein n=1 Tax=mine drainage metagenome TaxID=410659 RepID=A0A1J5QL60_9ZZZZ
MAYRFDARGRRAPLAAALAAVMLGSVGADAYAGSSGEDGKIGAKAKEVTARPYQSRLERIRAKYGPQQKQPGTDSSVDANSKPGHKYKADANGAKARKVDMDRINRLAQPKVVKSAKTESKPEVQARRVAGKAKPGGDLQRRVGVVRSELPRPPLALYGYKPMPSYSVFDQVYSGVVQRQTKQMSKLVAKLEADNAQVERKRLEDAHAWDVERQTPPHAVRYRNAELKHLSAAEMLLALFESEEMRKCFGFGDAFYEQAHVTLAALRSLPPLQPGSAEGLHTLEAEIEQLSQEELARAFVTALPDQAYTLDTFRNSFGHEIEPKLVGGRVFGFRLREVMPFKHLPYPGNIAAVVARVTEATADNPRYVVAHFDEQGDLRAPAGFARLGSGAEPNEDVGGGFDSAELIMEQVEFVIYRPYPNQLQRSF